MMKERIDNFLRKLKLIDSFEVQLEMEQIDFFKKLQAAVDEGSLGLLSNFEDIFSSHVNVYKGRVDYSEFKIKKKVHLFSFGEHFPVAEGSYTQNNGRLNIHTNIIGVHGYILYTMLFALVAYLITILALLFTIHTESIWIVLFVFFHAFILFGVFYLIFRRNTRKIKQELEKAFNSLDPNTPPHFL